jgi:toxin YoeB
MEIKFTDDANRDLEYWKKTHNVKVLKRIRELLEAILQDPYKGIGDPEVLKHQLSGYWSRHINLEHRLVYKISGNVITVISCRFYY